VYKLPFGSDLLAGISIVVSLILGQYLAGTVILLMFSGGTTLQEFGMKRASAVLSASEAWPSACSAGWPRQRDISPE
jgi:hypothetical protein